MMQFLLARHIFMHMYPFFSLYLFWVVIVFYFLSLLDRLRMAPKRKSTPTRNPFRSGSFSSFDPPILPFHVQFHDEKAH